MSNRLIRRIQKIEYAVLRLDVEYSVLVLKKNMRRIRKYEYAVLSRPNRPLVLGFGLLQAYDRAVLSAHQFFQQVLGTVRFRNDQLAAIMGYVSQIRDSDLEVTFRKHTSFVCDLEGVDLLTGSRGTNLYTLPLEDMMKSSPIYLLSKASKTKSWLWHRRLSHLNFGTINNLAKQGLVRGLPKLKYEKDHLCSACSLGKSKKRTHKPKSEDSIQEKLYLLHMDLYGPMRVESINGKKYILVIVDDYSRKPDLKYFHVFGAMCYPTNDSKDLGKLKPKADISPIHADTTGTPSSTSIDQDAPFAKPSSEESSLRDVITTNLHPANPPFEHLSKWTKNHPLDDVIGNPSRLVSTRRQLQTDAMWCYFDAFPTSVEPKNYKEALKEYSWIEAMQDGIHDFEYVNDGKNVFLSLTTNFSKSQRHLYNPSKYALEILKKYPVDTPMVERTKLDKDLQEIPIDSTRYRVKWAFRYLKGTTNMGLWYSKDTGIVLTAYADVAHTGCQDTRRSTSGSAQFLGDRLVSSSSKKQKSTTISTTETEYIALSGCFSAGTMSNTQDPSTSISDIISSKSKTVDAPDIYMQQFWYIVTYDLKAKTNFFTLDDVIFEVNADLLCDEIKASDDYMNYLVKSLGIKPVKSQGKGLLTTKGVEVAVETIRVPNKRRSKIMIKETSQSEDVADTVDYEETEEDDETPLIRRRQTGVVISSGVHQETNEEALDQTTCDEIKASDDYMNYLAKSLGTKPIKSQGKGLLNTKGVEVAAETIRVPNKRRSKTVIKETSQSEDVADTVDYEETEEDEETPLIRRRQTGVVISSGVHQETNEEALDHSKKLKGIEECEGSGMAPEVHDGPSGSSTSSSSKYEDAIEDISGDDERSQADDT
ncbi:retrovirus-related pol polyprotein from transposon TNT 1-94 [Tanacetum coccineum]